ncbi:hypothetical protein WDW37_09550 [Bdellovibrionota bacterium FG-1]
MKHLSFIAGISLLLLNSVLPQAALAANPPLAIFFTANEMNKGKGAAIETVDTVNDKLILTTEFKDIIEVPFLSNSRMRTAAEALRQGNSIDLSSCLEMDLFYRTFVPEREGWILTYTATIHCTLLISTPIRTFSGPVNFEKTKIGDIRIEEFRPLSH